MPVGRWKFKVRSDDGVRLFLDDRLLIDRWVSPPSGTLEAIVDLAAARREVRVEYYERTGNAMCKLELELSRFAAISTALKLASKSP